MQTASDRCAISGVISRPDPTLPVGPEDVLEELETPPVVVSGIPSSTPPPPPSLMGLLTDEGSAEYDSWADEMALLQIARPGRAVRIIRAVAMGLVPIVGILVAIAIHKHIDSEPTQPPSDQAALAKIGIRVNPPEATKKGLAKTTRTRHKTARKARRVRAKKVHRHRLSKSRKRTLRRQLKSARRAYARRQWKRARRLAKRALRIDRTNRKARFLKRAADRRIARQNRVIKRNLKRAKRDLKTRRYKRARRRAMAVLKLDPRNRSARTIKRRAERKLRRRRRG